MLNSGLPLKYTPYYLMDEIKKKLTLLEFSWFDHLVEEVP